MVPKVNSIHKIFSKKNELYLLLFFISISVLWKAYLVSRPYQFQISQFLADDAFYYFQLARNAAEGFIFTADRINNTNGFTFLYFILTTIIAFFIDDTAEYILVVHLINTILSVIAVYFIYKALIDFHPLSRWFTILFLLFNPYMVFISLIGVDASVQFFFVAIFIYVFKNSIKNSNVSLLFCIILPLTFLARSDAVFLVCYSAFAYFLLKIEKWKELIVKISLFSFLILLPWFSMSIYYTGKIAQDSFLGISLRHRVLLDSQNLLFDSTSAINYFVKLVNVLFHSPFFLVVFLVFSIYILVAGKLKNTLKSDCLFYVALISLLTTIFYYGFIFQYRQYWYLNLPLILTACICGYLIEFVLRGGTQKYKNYMTVILLIIIVSYTGFSFNQNYNLRNKKLNFWQAQYYETAIKLHKEHPEIKKIGAFNSGIYSYFSKITVINLDGVVNSAVLPFLKEKKLDTYLKKEGIEYILDHEKGLDSSFEHFSEEKIKYKVIQRTKCYAPWGGDLLLIKLEQGL